MKKILVTGGHGFIGRHIVDRLSQESCEVVTTRRGCSLTEGLDWCDVVVHLGWSSVPHSSNLDPIADVSDNVLGSVKLLQQCVEKQVDRVVFLSSGGTVYGRPEASPIPEGHPIRPISSYGITKAAVENYLHFFSENHELDYVILRGANAYGPGQNFSDGQGAIGKWLNCALRNEPISLIGDGTQIRDFVHVSDLTRALLAGVETKSRNSIFNIGSGKGISLLDVIGIIGTATGKELEIDHYDSRTFDVRENILDCSLAMRELGWAPEVDLEQGIREPWEWMKNQEISDR